eukprot:TRINITY_DN20473_c0_g1_i2.p1 TRINITY_DN20473_c0_g1~~TRINITY_DN20473_c0_g1_i2.p1  ORF type:complete len:606 (+),score=194.65 TRINITY_DN20473_c0_g1_i2:84-1901(+)
MIRRPPRSTLSSSSAASDVYKSQPLSAMSYHGSRALRLTRQKALNSRYGICDGEGVRHAEYLKRLKWETELANRETAHQEETRHLRTRLASLEENCTVMVVDRLQEICTQMGQQAPNGSWVQVADVLEQSVHQLISTNAQGLADREQLEHDLSAMAGLNTIAKEANEYAEKMQQELDAYKEALNQAGTAQEDLMAMLRERESVNKSDHERLDAAEAALEKSVLAEAEAIEARNTAELEKGVERKEFQKLHANQQQQIAELEFRLTEAMEVARQEATQLAEVSGYLQTSSAAELQAAQQSVVMDAANRELVNRIRMLETELEKSKTKLKKVSHERERALQFYKETKAGEEEARKEISKVRRDSKEMVARAKSMIEASEQREAALKETLESISGSHRTEKVRAENSQRSAALKFVKRAILRALSVEFQSSWANWRENLHAAKCSKLKEEQATQMAALEKQQASTIQASEKEVKQAQQERDDRANAAAQLGGKLENAEHQCRALQAEVQTRLGLLLRLFEKKEHAQPVEGEAQAEPVSWQMLCSQAEVCIKQLQADIATEKEASASEIHLACSKVAESKNRLYQLAHLADSKFQEDGGEDVELSLIHI